MAELIKNDKIKKNSTTQFDNRSHIANPKVYTKNVFFVQD